MAVDFYRSLKYFFGLSDLRQYFYFFYKRVKLLAFLQTIITHLLPRIILLKISLTDIGQDSIPVASAFIIKTLVSVSLRGKNMYTPYGLIWKHTGLFRNTGIVVVFSQAALTGNNWHLFFHKYYLQVYHCGLFSHPH